MRTESILIKQYPNRRLYDPKRARYLSLDELAVMVGNGERFVVRDAKTGADITRDVLDRLH